MPRYTLEVRDLAVERGHRQIISGLSFTVSPGEALIVTGPNGAGKTTLVRTIAGFVHRSHGEIRLVPDRMAPDGATTPNAEPEVVAERAHVIGHNNGIKSSLTVAENLTFARNYLASPPTACDPSVALDAALDRLGLSALANIPAGLLSAGQKRRLCLARLLVAHRPLWLLDEPTVSLDVQSTQLVASLIDAHVGSGGLALIVTHVPLGLKAARELPIAAIGQSLEPEGAL